MYDRLHVSTGIRFANGTLHTSRMFQTEADDLKIFGAFDQGFVTLWAGTFDQKSVVTFDQTGTVLRPALKLRGSDQTIPPRVGSTPPG